MKKAGLLLILSIFLLTLFTVPAKAQTQGICLKTDKAYPLVEVNYYIVDPEENFYFRNTFFNQIQVYNNESKFLYALIIDTNKKYVFYFNKTGLFNVAFDDGVIWVINNQGILDKVQNDRSLFTYDNADDSNWYYRYETSDGSKYTFSFQNDAFGVSTFCKGKDFWQIDKTYDIHNYNMFTISSAVLIAFGGILFLLISLLMRKFIKAEQKDFRINSGVRFKEYSKWIHRHGKGKRWNYFGMNYIEKDLKKHEFLRLVFTKGSLLALSTVFMIIIIRIGFINYFALDLYLSWILIGLMIFWMDRSILAYRFKHVEFDIKGETADIDACPVCKGKKPDFWTFIMNIKNVDLKCYHCGAEYEEVPRRNRIITLVIAFFIALGLAYILFITYFNELWLLSLVWAYAAWHIVILLSNLRYFKTRFRRVG